MDGSGVLMGPSSARHRRHPGWPAIVGPVDTSVGMVALRPLRRRDGGAWRRLRVKDQELIERWDATSPVDWATRHNRHYWRIHYAALTSAARRGRALPFAITLDGRFAGQMTVGGIERGPQSSGWVGYWLDAAWHGHRVATTALALAVAHALGPARMHRIEATISPENHASVAVVRNIGMREEGVLQRYLDIFGAWRDHALFAMTVEELPARPDVTTTASALLHRADRGRGAG